MQCEMCGKDTELFLTEIEGIQLQVCKICGSHGSVIKRVLTPQEVVKKEEKEKEAVKRLLQPSEEKEVVQLIVEGYPKLIKDAREKLKLSQEEFALKISEKQNLIHHIETGKMEPNLDLARKIEKFLHIKLVDQVEMAREHTKSSKNEPLTIGDMITVKSRKKL